MAKRKRVFEPVVVLRRHPFTRHVIQVNRYDPRTGRVTVYLRAWDGERSRVVLKRLRESDLTLLRETGPDDDRERLAGVLARRAVKLV